MNKHITANKVLKNDYFNIKICSLNKKCPKTFFIELSGILEPEEERLYDVDREIKTPIEKMASKIKLEYDFLKNYICNVDLSEESICNSKKTRFTVNLYFLQNKYNLFSELFEEAKNISEEASDYLNTIMNTNKIKILNKND